MSPNLRPAVRPHQSDSDQTHREQSQLSRIYRFRTLSERVTNDGLEGCRELLLHTTTTLERHMQLLMDQLMTKSKTTMISEDEVADLARLREEWNTTRQSLHICSEAENRIKENVSLIDNYAKGDETVQFLVSTSDKTIHGKNRDESLQQLSRDISSISNTADKFIIK
ncbi:hypothetical protein QBC33DRAFT_598298 [Phialemonium atrogriseum]|uniref:Azaphilone pigments biosynthesis cluster protein L N-terminal domain-containing protein n=1 Tax=Phialemonium atrogriseum TaxID=1093897 RepID=A0AAJ0FCC3_9PEZI|nr:uncharacterized protein QBC33DRAFT_598298 [Phialemonium atrogriseum]KAK1763451.1 hypothetical protein QBC33DRAFT_598298 [Phialemonium atrogriseum]